MYCDNCGCELGADATVCPICGKLIEMDIKISQPEKQEDNAVENPVEKNTDYVSDKPINPTDNLVAADVEAEEIPTMVINTEEKKEERAFEDKQKEQEGRASEDKQKEQEGRASEDKQEEQEGSASEDKQEEQEGSASEDRQKEQEESASEDKLEKKEEQQTNASVIESFVQSEEDDEGTTVLTNPGPVSMNVSNGTPMPPMGGPNGMPMPPVGGPNGMPMPPMGGPNGMPMPPMGGPNGTPMPPMGGPNGMPMPPMGGPNGMPMPPMGANGAANPPQGKKENKQKKKMSKGCKITLIAIPVVIVIAAAVLAVIFVPKFKNYNDAADKLDDGKVEEAVEIFADLGSFKDAETMANGGAYYEYAADMMAEGNYTVAAEYFEKAAELDFKDSSDKAKECYYNVGNTYKSEGKYDEAVEAYEKAGDYNGAADAANECRYEKAVSYMSEGDYDSAISCFEALGAYGDSETKIGECYYHKAELQVSSGDYMGAYDNFIKSEYEDYNNQANECIYMYAKSCYDEGKYDEAIENYGKVEESYKDCTEAIDNCYIALAEKASKDKDYKTAVEYYEKTEKADVTKKVRNAKLSYIKENKDAKDALTMQYLGDLRYAGNSDAAEIYKELVGWNIESYVNHEQEDYETKGNTIDTKSNIYIHSLFTNSDEKKMDIEGYLVYSDGTKTNVIDFGTIENEYVTWVSVNASDAKTGLTYLYITDKTTGNIVEVYPFVIE